MQRLVPACRKRHCGVQQVKLVVFFRIKIKGKVKSHFETIPKVTVSARRRSAIVPKFFVWQKLPEPETGERAGSLGMCLQQGTRRKVEIEVREAKMNET